MKNVRKSRPNFIKTLVRRRTSPAEARFLVEAYQYQEATLREQEAEHRKQIDEKNQWIIFAAGTVGGAFFGLLLTLFVTLIIFRWTDTNDNIRELRMMYYSDHMQPNHMHFIDQERND